jgi:hypothetical protein
MNRSETLIDIKNLFINDYGSLIVIDISGCKLDHVKQIVTLSIAKLRTKVGLRQQTKTVDVKLDDGDVRSFRVPKNIDRDTLLHEIINQRAFEVFEKWA